MSHFLLLSPFTCLDTRLIVSLLVRKKKPKKKNQNNLIWVQFFVAVVSLATDQYWFLWSFSYTALAVCPGTDVFICSCQCRGVSSLRSIFSAVDITGLYKVMKKGQRGGFLQKCPRCLCAKLTLRDSGHCRGRGNTGAISAQAPSGGTWN